jgi:structural maintenance of chromosome 4
MPPRRSTRAARSSVEPQPTLVAKSVSKRKRTTEEKENLAKPALSNGKVALKEALLESDDGKDEREAEHREVKRRRPSPELEDAEGESEEEVKPKRTSRNAAASANGRQRKVVDISDDEDDYAENVKPTLKARKPPAKRVSKANNIRKASSSSKGSSAGQLSSRSAKSAPLTDSDEDDMVIVRKPTNKKKKADYASSVEDLYASDSEPADASSTSKKNLAPPPSSKKHARGESTPASATSPERSLLDNDSEPEQSLLEPAPTRLPPQSPSKSQTYSQPKEEPKGPKSRLVIHKMALVNFKSYAGRQEIGPFHKVIIFSRNGSS